MPSILDVFDGSGYTCAELTTGINKLPYVPGRLGRGGLFAHKGVSTTVVMVERHKGKIALIPTKTRGSGQTTKRSAEKRDLRPFSIPHIPSSDTLLADSIQNVRAFGTSDRLEAINTKVQEVLVGLRRDQEITHEYHRIGAIQGVVLDADGTSEIFDFFSEFNITREQIDFALDDDLTKVKLKCDAVYRAIEGSLGAVPFTGVTAQVGDGFWDSLISHPAVEKAFDKYQEGAHLRNLQRDQVNGEPVRAFEFCNIRFENYRGRIGDVPFIPHLEAAFYPTGVPELFTHYSAPADYMETVNTIGQPVYVKQERMKFDRGVEFEAQSNPAMICTRPETLIQGITAIAAQVEEEAA